LSFPKGDPLAKVLYEKCVAIGRKSKLGEDWGPNLLTRTILGLGLPADMFGTTATFYPIDWISAFTLMLPAYRDEIEGKVNAALFFAAYQSFFQYCGIDLSRTPPKGTYLAELYETFAPERMSPVTYTTDEILSHVRTLFKPEFYSWLGQALDMTQC
jgi:hypothetical protein